jgi:epoxyqueuosine reductase
MWDGGNVFKLVFAGIIIMDDHIDQFLDKNGYNARLVPAQRLKDLENDFRKVVEKGSFDQRVMDVYLRNLSFDKPEGMKKFRSIIIMSKSRPAHRLGLSYRGRKLKVLIPPTYVNYQRLNGRVFSLFRDWLGSNGGIASVARLPLKLLSARSGLARYGKNNISYIGKWGSYHQLFAFYTDLEPESDPWQEIKSLGACASCDLCRKYCPTGAIRKDRFLLDTGKCLTLLNESEEDMPSWVSPDAHNSLIGCIRCQEICPYNSKVKEWVEDIGELDEEETEMLLSFDINKDKDKHIIKRTKELGIYEFFAELIPRNLQLLLNNLER